MVILLAQNPAELEAKSREYRALIQEAGGVAELSTQDCAAIPGPRDHFGYRDGISDIVVEGTPERPKPNKGPTVKPGEFFFGYPDETGATPQMPQPEVLGRNGSYLVYRRLYEDVGAFRTFLRTEGDSPEESEWLAAKIVGRWRSGAPLVLAPNGDDPALADDATRNNDFNYAEMDPQGLACPLGAHIRRVNPRDAVANVQRNRLIRRGLPYGPTLVESAPDDGADRGVTIFFGNASLARQFEFVQRIWINDSTFIGLGNEKDPLIGANDGSTNLTIPRKPFRKRITNLPRFTIVKGGGYFFLPGIKALRFLANGAES
jgi:Dyp-type peroxidase family